ncbi:MAG: PIN domain-containing protein [Calditrichaeota bacterium]|nr:PIN domain-containing protein [Calditrichota bacterium]
MSSAARTGSRKIRTYVLDTSAILTFLKAEPGVEILDDLFSGTDRHFIISFLTLYEIYTATFRNHSKQAADFLLRATLQLGLDIDYDNALDEVISAGIVCGDFQVSPIGAWIASLAIRKRAALVHKDPEFEALKDHLDLLYLSSR